MKAIKQYLAMFFAGIFLICTSGCQAETDIEPVHITLMHGWGGSASDHVAMRAIYDGFQKENPDIVLQYDASPDISVVIEKAKNLLVLGRVPDIISTNGYADYLEDVVSRGRTLDLTPFLEEDPEFAANVGKAVQKTWQNPEGQLYTLPDALEVSGYWYNEDILQAAGVTEDGTTTAAVKPPATFYELWEASDRIAAWAAAQNNGIAPMVMDGYQPRILLGAGIAANSPQGAAFMQKELELCPQADLQAAMSILVKAYSYYKGPTASVNDVRQIFFSEKSAFYFNGVWAGVELSELSNPPNVHCAPLPGEYGQSIAYVSSSSGYVIGNTRSPQKIDACVRFLKYMLSTEVQQRIAAETAQVPSNPNISTAWIAGKQPQLGASLAACYTAPQQILTLNTVLDKDHYAVVESFLAQQPPTEEDCRKLIDSLCKG